MLLAPLAFAYSCRPWGQADELSYHATNLKAACSFIGERCSVSAALLCAAHILTVLQHDDGPDHLEPWVKCRPESADGRQAPRLALLRCEMDYPPT